MKSRNENARNIKISAYITARERKSWQRASVKMKLTLSDLIRNSVNEALETPNSYSQKENTGEN